jgi:hypothetical protein
MLVVKGGPGHLRKNWLKSVCKDGRCVINIHSDVRQVRGTGVPMELGETCALVEAGP